MQSIKDFVKMLLLLGGCLGGLLAVAYAVQIAIEGMTGWDPQQAAIERQLAWDAEPDRIQAQLPSGCRFLDLGSFQRYGHIVLVHCDGKHATTLRRDFRVSNKIIRREFKIEVSE